MLSFDQESRAGAAPYAGRHRKGWPPGKSSWRRVYMQRVRIARSPDAEAQATHRGLPADYDHRKS